MNEASKPLCPSSPAKDGALLIAVVVGNTVSFLQPAMAVSREDLSGAGECLEDRFRFSLPCLHDACHNFKEGRCDLIQKFLRRQATENCVPSGPIEEDLAHLPNCPIRSRCQWFRTAGVRACGICPSTRRPQY